MSENEAGRALQVWSTKVFLHVLRHVGGEGEGWVEWLCGNLSVLGMNVLGLDGEAAVKEVCEGIRVGESWCWDPWLC